MREAGFVIVSQTGGPVLCLHICAAVDNSYVTRLKTHGVTHANTVKRKLFSGTRLYYISRVISQCWLGETWKLNENIQDTFFSVSKADGREDGENTADSPHRWWVKLGKLPSASALSSSPAET
jgi:hypothetical protein